MKTYKIRHQLFLPEDMSRRLSQLAAATGRARSELLVEAVGALFTRREAPRTDEAVGTRLTRIERQLDWLRRNEGMVWELLARMARHQLVLGAVQPIAKEAEAAGAKLFSDLIDEIADRLAGKAPEESADPAIRKLRTFQ